MIIYDWLHTVKANDIFIMWQDIPCVAISIEDFAHLVLTSILNRNPFVVETEILRQTR